MNRDCRQLGDCQGTRLHVRRRFAWEHPLGALLTAPIAVGLITLTGSWRWVFVILGVPASIWLFWWLRIFTNRPDENPRVSQTELQTIRSQDEVSRGREYYGRTEPGNSAGGTSSRAAPWFSTLSATSLYVRELYDSYVDVPLSAVRIRVRTRLLVVPGYDSWIGACFTVLFYGGRISDWLSRRTGSLWIARSGFAMVSLGVDNHLLPLYS